MSKITYKKSSAVASRVSNTSSNHIFDNITKTECITIYENIKNNKTIYNPNTKRKLKYDSPITQKILQECYIKYKMKELPNVIDPKNLFGNKTPPGLPPNSPPKQSSPPGLPPNSPPKQSSPPGAKQPSPPGAKQSSPPGAKPNSPPKQSSPPGLPPNSPPKQPSPPGAKTKDSPNDYTSIYNEFNDLRKHYTDDKLKDLLNKTNLNIDIKLFKDFIKSCKLIENKQTIPYENIVENHFNCIINLLSKIKSSNYIVCYDNKFVEDLKLLATKNINCVINKNKFTIVSNTRFLNIYNYMDAYRYYENPYIYPESILINSVFSRILLLNCNGKKCLICPFKTSLKLDIKKYNKRIPTKFAHNFKDNHTVNNKLNYITAFLNCFSQQIANNIVVEDKDSIKQFVKIAGYFPNLTDRECEDLTTVLLNNSYFNIYAKNTSILTTNFDGTVCHSTLDKMTYLYDVLKYYQPYNIPLDVMYNIEGNYKNKGIQPFSRELNIELSNLFKDPKTELTQIVKSRLIEMFKFNNDINMGINYDKGLFVFHGTAGKLNSNVITSFLSTSLNINVAIKYSYTYTTPHIYIFKIKNITSTNAKYITFNDQLQQLLLLPGTQLIEHNCFDYFNYKFIFCDVIMPTQTFINKLQKEIETNSSKYKIKYNYDLTNYITNNYINIITYNSSSLNNTSIFRNSLYITTDNQYLLCMLLFEAQKQNNAYLNLKYTIHQLVINNIYNYLVPNNTIKYNLINFNNGEILTGWKYDSTLTSTNKNPNYKYDFELLLPDIFCNNTDLANNLSYLVAQDNKLKRVWFKTTGIFNGVAGQDITLDDLVPGILNKIFEEKKNKIINTAEIYNNNKINVSAIIKASYDKLVEFKTTNELKNILNEQINLITNILKIPSVSEEYKDLLEMFDIILKYMTAKIDYVLNLDINELIKTVNNKMNISGGKMKQYSSSSSEKITKSKNNNQLYANTDPTTFDEYGYEITNVDYSSTQTISLEAFKGILKKYYT